MTTWEREILERFKLLLSQKLDVHKIVLFGSRAWCDSTEYSDFEYIMLC